MKEVKVFIANITLLSDFLITFSDNAICRKEVEPFFLGKNDCNDCNAYISRKYKT